MPPDYDKHNPEQKQIYRFVRTLFSAAQLTAECAIVTLVSVSGRNSAHDLGKLVKVSVSSVRVWSVFHGPLLKSSVKPHSKH